MDDSTPIVQLPMSARAKTTAQLCLSRWPFTDTNLTLGDLRKELEQYEDPVEYMIRYWPGCGERTAWELYAVLGLPQSPAERDHHRRRLTHDLHVATQGAARYAAKARQAEKRAREIEAELKALDD